jgi:hypothetical protein
MMTLGAKYSGVPHSVQVLLLKGTCQSGREMKTAPRADMTQAAQTLAGSAGAAAPIDPGQGSNSRTFFTKPKSATLR